MEPHEPPSQPPDIKSTRAMGTVMAGIAWLIIIAMLTGFFSGWLDHRNNPNRDVSTRINGEGQREVVLERNRMGHYLANGFINGHPVTFLVDTGATGVALSTGLAREIGLRGGRPIVTQTANGPARGYATRLDSVRLGELEQNDVHATIAPGLADHQVLLGMSFLKNLELVQRGNSLTLRQP